MGRKRDTLYLVGDFETTVYDGQQDTQVWASGLVELYTEDAHIFHSINETYEYMLSLKKNLIVYYHNLEFDGSFWLYYLMAVLNYKQAVVQYDSDDCYSVRFLDNDDMKNKTFKYSINNLGNWYSVTIKVNDKIIELRDSLKLLPFSVKKLGDSFKTKHRKLDMEYKGLRYPGCYISDEEKEYLKNDLFVVKEALEITFNQGHNKLTIGSCCMAEYKEIIGKVNFDKMFPNLYEIHIDSYTYGSPTIGDYIRNSYKGGWCYCVKGKEGKPYYNGITADVNSLYPSMMSSESGNKYPIGLPKFFTHEIPKEALLKNSYYFVRIKTRFYLKKDYLPCIQIKNNYLYSPTKWLETSDVYNYKDGKYYKSFINFDGREDEAYVILTLTETDFKLIQDHYNLTDFEILDGCYFKAMIGIFDDYINKYKKIKLESEGAIRELAKLFLNNLYGKMGASTDSSFKYARLREDGSVGFVEIKEHLKTPGYIPVGSAITSYARNFTIRAAQKNYYGVNKRGFIYADTDSIHCDLSPSELKNIPVDSKNFCCWKLESSWNKAIFIRQKTYIEHIVAQNLEPCDEYYNIKCAGLPSKSKDLLIASFDGRENSKYKDEEEYDKLTDEEKTFISTKRDMLDFKPGITIPGKLLPKRIRGGTLLVEVPYEMR